MISTVLIKYLNWVNTKILTEQWMAAVLLFIDNCPSHTLVTLSNKCVISAKSTMSRFQPLDQGISTLTKKAHTWYTMGELLTTMKVSDNITRLAKKLTIFNSVLQTKVSWESGAETAIQKCSDSIDTMMTWVSVKAHPYQWVSRCQWWAGRCTPDNAFKVPWDEYLAFESQLRDENSVWACPARAYEVETTDQKTMAEVIDKPITIVQAIKLLKAIWTLCIRKPLLFSLENDLYSGLHAHKLKKELNEKTVQTSMAQFLINLRIYGLAIYIWFIIIIYYLLLFFM